MTLDYMALVGYAVVFLLLVGRIPKITSVFFISVFEEYSIVMKKYHELFPSGEAETEKKIHLSVERRYGRDYRESVP